MSTGYKITDQESIHFCTFTIVQWADLFTRQVYRDIVIDSFNYCIEAKGVRVHAPLAVGYFQRHSAKFSNRHIILTNQSTSVLKPLTNFP